MVGYFPVRMIGKILEDIKLGLTVVDKDGQVVWYNKRAQKLLGWDEKMGVKSVLNCHPPKTYEAVMQRINKVGNGEWHVVFEHNGRVIENNFSPAHIPGMFTGIVIITNDVTEREKMMEVIKQAAVTDELTGLYNRKYFEQIFQDLVTAKKPFGVIMLDVNALKYVNDHYGHDAGDQLIIKAAKLIKNSVRKTDYVFRYGGDEFVVLVRGDNPRVVKSIIARIRAHGSGNVLQSNDGFGINLSIGSCLSSEVSKVNEAREVIRCADERMYEDKKKFYAKNHHLLVRGKP